MTTRPGRSSPPQAATAYPTYRWPSNVRRNVRAVREHVGLDWMTPHTWRRTYATILDDEMSLTDRAKADLMGQAKFLKDTYVSRGELHPDAAVFRTPAALCYLISGRLRSRDDG